MMGGMAYLIRAVLYNMNPAMRTNVGGYPGSAARRCFIV